MPPLILEISRIAAWLLLLCAVFVPLERLAGLKRQAFFRPEFVTDLGYYVLNAVLIGTLLGTPLVLVSASIHQLIPAAALEAVAALPAGVRLGLSLLVGEIGFYWGHRLSHEIPFLWRFHSIHHSAEHVDFLTNSRAHPVDMVFTRMCGFAPVLALGLTGGPTVSALVLVLGTLWGFFVHANLRWRFGPLENLVATPFFHRWHHTNNAMRDRNYAAMFPLADRLFGTYHSPHQWPDGYGIDTPMPSSIGRQLVKPFIPNRTSRPEARTIETAGLQREDTQSSPDEHGR